MKKFIVAIVIFLVYCLSSTAQVTYSKPKQPTFEWLQSILHTFATDTYDLYIDSDNEFEDYSIIVKLGKGKEQALKSLSNIKKMFDDAKEDYTFYLGGHQFTKIFSDEIVATVNGKAGRYIVTDKDLNRWARMLSQNDEEEIYTPTTAADIEKAISQEMNKLSVEVTEYSAEELEEEPIPFMLVETKPKFNGGNTNEFLKWINENINYPRNFSGSYRVTTQVTIDKNGNLVKPKILRGANEELNNEALKVLAKSPKWTAGKQGDRNVNTTILIPIIFE